MTWYDRTSKVWALGLLWGSPSHKCASEKGRAWGSRAKGWAASVLLQLLSALHSCDWDPAACKAQNCLNRVWIYTASQNWFNYHVISLQYSPGAEVLLIQSSSLDILALPMLPSPYVCLEDHLPWHTANQREMTQSPTSTCCSISISGRPTLKVVLLRNSGKTWKAWDLCHLKQELADSESRNHLLWCLETSEQLQKSQYWDLSKVAFVIGWAHCQGGRFQDLQPPGNT